MFIDGRCVWSSDDTDQSALRLFQFWTPPPPIVSPFQPPVARSIIFDQVYEASSVRPFDDRFSSFTWSAWYMESAALAAREVMLPNCGYGTSKSACEMVFEESVPTAIWP